MIVSGIKGIFIYYGSGCQISQTSLYYYGYVIPLWPWICNILVILKGPPFFFRGFGFSILF